MNNKSEVIARGKVKDVGNPKFGIYDKDNQLVSVDLGDYNNKTIEILVRVIKE